MAQTLQTPGVYITEQDASPSSVVPVATAIPAFIGYTQQTISTATQGRDVKMTPTKITSLKEFEDFFGTGFTQTFTATATTPTLPSSTPPTPPALPANYKTASYPCPSLPPAPVLNLSLGQYMLTSGDGAAIDTNLFSLYSAIQLFYLNGGSTCYIVSLGTYAAATATTTPPSPALPLYSGAIATLELEPAPTMLLCPDALMYDIDDYNTVMQLMLAHCDKMQSRVALFDVYDGSGAGMSAGEDPSTVTNSPIDEFRRGVGQNYLNYGIAYFPWVNTTLFSASNITFLNIDHATLTALGKALNNEPNPHTSPPTIPLIAVPEWGTPNATLSTNQGVFAEASALQSFLNSPSSITLANLKDASGNLLTLPQALVQLNARITDVNNVLTASFPDYALLTAAIASYLNTQPVAPAMAGVFTSVDNNTGVWRAPANVSLTGVTSPAVELNDLLQTDMNVDAATGKSVNAIRYFQGVGTLVWGARTLAGNSQDWRYINVRRTMIFIEQSVKLAACSYVFAPNNANTWATVKSMISSFLFNIWKQGALAGSVPADAYSVAVGLDSTMTGEDILNGLMNITIEVAVAHPAEFIVITFQQEMQVS